MLPGWLGLEAWPGEEKLGELGFFSLEKGCLWGRLRAVPGAYREVIKTELRFTEWHVVTG